MNAGKRATVRVGRYFIFGMAVVLASSLAAFAGKKYQYNYSGYDAQHGRPSHLGFDMKPDGTVEGIQSIGKVCESGLHLAGAELHFAGHRTGSYPQVEGTFSGKALICGSTKEPPTSGTIKIGYHPQYGVFVQLFGSGTAEEYYHKTSKNPFE